MILPVLALAAAFTSAPTTPRETIDALFAAFNRHDVAALQRLYSPSAKLVASDFCHPRTGTDVSRTYSALFQEFPDIQDVADTVIIEGDRAAVRFTSTSHIQGKAFTLKLVTFFRFSDQGILEDDTVFDPGGRPCEP
jgi:predicted ester cyclase